MKSALKWGALIAILGLGAFAAPRLRSLPSAPLRGTSELGSRIERMDVLPAAKVARGLGFNIDPNRVWEFARAKAAGATEVRMQFPWPSVEKQRGVLQLTPQMARALDECVQNRLEPLVIAAYAPNAPALGEITVSADVPAGSTLIPVSGAPLSRIQTPLCHVLRSDGKQIVAEGRWAYYGALIDTVDVQNRTLSLAAKTNIALAQGTRLRVNELLYQSVATSDADDASLVAFGRYARFLASEIAARGLTGRVELWNEPPWVHDRWDARGGFYDQIPRGISGSSPNPGMLDHFLNGQAPPRGVSFVWGGSHKSGGRGLGARRGNLTAAQLRNVSADALHPYGDSPETHAWNPQAIRAGEAFSALALPGVNQGSNMKLLRQNQLAARGRGELAPRMVASEVGHLAGTETQKARYNLRVFLIYLSLGMDRVNFFKLADKPGKFGFIDQATQTPHPVFGSFQTLMQQIEAMPSAPMRFEIEDVPSIASYNGTFPLTVIPISAQNRWLMVSYQRTFATPPQKWDDLASPAPAPVQMRIPGGFRVEKAWNLVSGAAVAVQTRNGIASYEVSDDPIAIALSATR